MWKRWVAILGVAASLAPAAMALAPETRDTVKEELRNGSADAAIRRLDAAIGANPADAEAHGLLCRAYFGEEQWDAAVTECQQAVELAPNSSTAHLWLGRAEGEKADHIARLSAFGLARKVRTEFETAVKLDGNNAEALADLGEFYAEAPGIVGGGTGKAEAVAGSLDRVDRARAEELRGRIETGRNNPAGAEQHFTAAVAAAREPADAWMDLASFYARQGQWDKMEAAIRSGIAADPKRDAALVDGARVLLRAGRDLPLAGRMLRMYLDSGEKTSNEPAYRVHALLGRAMAQQGDATGAQREFAAATSMASGFHAGGQGNSGR